MFKNMFLKFKNYNLFIFFHIFLFISLLCLVYIKHGLNTTLSCFYGSLVSLFSSLLFLFIFFFNGNKSSANFIVKKFYLAGFIKFLFLSFCVFIFIIFGISSYIYFFIFLFFTQLYFWIFCILLFRGYSFYERK